MSDLITVTGVVGSDPRAIVTSQGLPITSFRLASKRRFFDRAAGTWQDGETNWYTVSAFRQLAFNAGASLHKGERVVVHGRLKLRAWTAGDKAGTSVEIEADTIGHDLVFGISQMRRLQPARDDQGADASALDARDGTLSSDDGAAGFATGGDAIAGDELRPEATDDERDGFASFDPSSEDDPEDDAEREASMTDEAFALPGGRPF
ncbi:single-stranded DNA-binding protein [Agromyces sp. G08B096]|uniref:Single-stranded DNA-binding protein n=1 Tax=Agromyces sp. G08B096 TaxID=3156399 RepID=A0AAU7WAK3_9MICO